MTIADPAHWKEKLADQGDKYDKIVEIIAEINTPTIAVKGDESSYIHKVSAAKASRQKDNVTTFVDNNGVFTSDTGTPGFFFIFEPPEWMVKFAEDNSKTITFTAFTVHWDDTDSTDYLTTTRVWWVDFDSASNTPLLNDTTNYGSGTASFRSDAFNPTDHAVSSGDYIFIRLDFSQATGSSCDIKGFEITYTMT